MVNYVIIKNADYQLVWSGKASRKLQSNSTMDDAAAESDLKELTDAFIRVFQEVIRAFEQLPIGPILLKQTLALLALPQKLWGVVHLIRPGFYTEAKSVREIMMQIFPFMNPVSYHLLSALARLSGCAPATKRVADFIQLRSSKSHLLLCTDEWSSPTTPDGLNDLNTTYSSDAQTAHLASLDELQSMHQQTLARLPNLGTVKDVVRVSATINAKCVSLSDYDSIVTAICGFFLLPKSALVYVGCMRRPLTLCWSVTKEISLYMKFAAVNVTCELLLAEQKIVNLMIGDWLNYKCCSVEVRKIVNTRDSPSLKILSLTLFLISLSLLLLLLLPSPPPPSPPPPPPPPPPTTPNSPSFPLLPSLFPCALAINDICKFLHRRVNFSFVLTMGNLTTHLMISTLIHLLL